MPKVRLLSTLQDGADGKRITGRVAAIISMLRGKYERMTNKKSKGAVRLPSQLSPPLRGVTDIRFRSRDYKQYAAKWPSFQAQKGVGSQFISLSSTWLKSALGKRG